MKHLVIVVTMLFGLNLFADTAQRAEEFYGQRGENVENALTAADIYHQLAIQESAQEAKAEFLIRESEARYYVGSHWDKKKYKLTAYSQGVATAETVVKMFAQPANPEQEELKVQGLYWYGANLGKHGKTKGIFASAGNIPKLKEAMNTIINMGYEDIYSYGAYRILGRLADQTPGILGGSKKKAKEYLAKAFENTLLEDASLEVSVHGLNNIYYAEVLVKKNKEQACLILSNFTQQDPLTLLETRIAETIEEIATAEGLLTEFKCQQ